MKQWIIRILGVLLFVIPLVLIVAVLGMFR